jgi:hypothetical protein
MSVTGKQVYDMAMVLIDEVTEIGSVQPDTPKYYETRSKSILTTLQAELLPPSETPTVITDLTQDLDVSDRIALLVMPYGLASHLLVQEDVNTASYFNARYDELKRKIPTDFEDIEDNLGVLGGMQ